MSTSPATLAGHVEQRPMNDERTMRKEVISMAKGKPTPKPTTTSGGGKGGTKRGGKGY